MKLLIIADQEGCSGVLPSQSNSERNLLMQKQVSSVLADIEADWQITVLDCHDNGLNLFPIKEKFPHINIVSQLWNFNVKEHYDGAIFVGFHVARNEDSPFAHTFRTEIIKTMLNGENVGEVTLLTQWLQSNHIPVLWINGEETLRIESEKLNIPFVSNIELMNGKLNFNFHVAMEYSDINAVSIRLVHEKLLDAFPDQLFQKSAGYIIFRNIDDYLNHLSEVSIFLNAARNYYVMYFKKLINRIKWSYSREEIEEMHDKRLSEIIFHSSIFSLRNDDLAYIESVIIKNSI